MGPGLGRKINGKASLSQMLVGGTGNTPPEIFEEDGG